MIYTNTNKVAVSKKEFENMQELANVNFEETDEETIERLGATTDDAINWLYFKFENGKTITIDICSGTSNYYVNAVLWSKDKEIEIEFDDESGIEEEMEFVICEDDFTEDTYICKIDII